MAKGEPLILISVVAKSQGGGVSLLNAVGTEDLTGEKVSAKAALASQTPSFTSPTGN